MKGEPVHILMVEDNEGDVLLTKEALKSGKVSNQISVVQDGLEALEFLHREGKYSDAVRPDLILLDLNLPRKDGHEFLAEVKADPGFRQIPVVVLTSSGADQDVLTAYDLHANCYVVKPVGLGALTELVESIEEFWFTVARLPSIRP